MLASMMGWRKGESMNWGPAWDGSASCVGPEGFEEVEARLQQWGRRFPAAEGS